MKFAYKIFASLYIFTPHLLYIYYFLTFKNANLFVFFSFNQNFTLSLHQKLTGDALENIADDAGTQLRGQFRILRKMKSGLRREIGFHESEPWATIISTPLRRDAC